MRRLAVRPMVLVTMLVACASAIVVCLPASAGASVTVPTVTGTWSCCGSGGASTQTWTITESGGSLSGTASNPEPFSPISGSISGTSVEIVTGPYIGSTYSATFVGTISTNGESMSGTWSSNDKPPQTGTWSATRTSGSPTVTIETAQEKEAKEKEAKAKLNRPGNVGGLIA